jgi:hypothetical protein
MREIRTSGLTRGRGISSLPTLLVRSCCPAVLDEGFTVFFPDAIQRADDLGFLVLVLRGEGEKRELRAGR